MASILLIPDAIAPSDLILNCHISAVFFTCVPPHNSTESPNFIVLTTSSYFSPKRAIAPLSIASCIGTSRFSINEIWSSIFELTKDSTWDNCMSEIFS